MKEKKHSNEAEGPLAIVLGAAFVGRLIAVPLPGWAGSVKDALGRFLALLVAISHVAVLVQVSFPRRSSEVITKLLKLEEELPPDPARLAARLVVAAGMEDARRGHF